MSKRGDRDAAIDRLLRSGRPEPSAAAGDVCLDAETLAAWADGTLPGSERARLEAHAAGCGRCQALLAAMVRSEPVLIAPERRWSPWRAVRWAVPLSAAAALALWFAVDRDVARDSAKEQPIEAPSSAPVQAPPSASPAPTAPSQSAPAAATAASPGAVAGNTSVPKDARGSRMAAKGSGTQAERDRLLAADRFERRDTQAAAPQGLTESVTVPAAAPPTASPTAAPATPRAPAVPQTGTQQNSTQQTLPPPSGPSQQTTQQAPPPPAAPQQTPPSVQSSVQKTEPKRAAPQGTEEVVTTRAESRFRTAARADWTEVVSPDPLIRWRFAARGTVERSADGGMTWKRENTRVTGVVIAGSAPSPSVCWLAGRAGLILRFTTAAGWQRLTIPAPIDVVSVEAQSADTATVMLVDGRRLTTTDGGASWR